MRTTRYLAAAALAFLICGCPARSFFPLFAEKDHVFNPSLVGTWADEDGREIYTFDRLGEKSYRLVYREYKPGHQEGPEGPADSAMFVAHLGRIGKHWFIDCSPAGIGDYHLLPVHTFWRMSLDADTLRIAALEGDWLQKMVDSSKLKIPHVKVDTDLILTASSEELQQLVLRYADDKVAFPNPGVLVRTK